ncbi:hypothetical protein JOF29_006741 [Kribbella aluminosa]|uniref:Uncharacterized protein n=1 Tax=Kribbella aluminosa TaxID=416017 RepID=A0ABS4UVN8_9ACTN|nr:hypothetical protein [Kribbella aluminosa]
MTTYEAAVREAPLVIIPVGRRSRTASPRTTSRSPAR